MSSETSGKDIGPAEEEKALSIGPLLKAARENKGFTLDQMADETKLRRYLLEAIENENWVVLPAPVFVKGFIRSYARALDLSVKDIVAQYESIEELKEPSPKPLILPPSSRNVPIIILILALAALAVFIFLWRGSDRQSSTLHDPDKASQSPEKSVEETSAHTIPPGGEITPATEITTEMASIQEFGPEERQESVPEITGEKDNDESQEETRIIPESEPPAEDKKPGPVIDSLTLKAQILERTWVRIYVDDKEPKEYIFRPGSRPQWKARTGFEVLIGNASGIELEFNDKQYKNLGRRGQVIRLHFPEEFRADITEE